MSASTDLEILTGTTVKSPLSAQTEKFLAGLRDHLPALHRDYGVQTLWLFGSRVRGEEKPTSDLDLLVEFDDRSLSLLKFVELENRLSDWLEVKVDLVEKKTLKPAIGRHILEEAMVV